ATNVILFGTALAFVLVAVAGFFIGRSITAPLGAFGQFVERIGQGDLTQQAAAGGGDEVARLGGTLNQMVAGLRDLARQTSAAVETGGAGEHGSRFAVVAGEMKSLEEQAKESTSQVQAILGAIQKGINSAVMLTEEAVKRAEAGKEEAETTEGVIRQLAETT